MKITIKVHGITFEGTFDKDMYCKEQFDGEDGPFENDDVLESVASAIENGYYADWSIEEQE